MICLTALLTHMIHSGSIGSNHHHHRELYANPCYVDNTPCNDLEIGF